RIAFRFPGVEPGVWADRIIDRYVDRVAATPPLEGVVAVMGIFADVGIRQVCVSNSGRRIVDANLAAIGVRDLIEFSISLDDVARGKPDPFPYAEAARRLGLPAAQMAAVEDSATGARSALGAGMHLIGIAPGGGEVPGALVTLTSLERLPALILPGPAAGQGTP
ncbi:MAG: HAD family hydrolase, partial [Alphaproteobacteria bacterium]|nr:HAD family hydrolase [Alphaproteobacteria bacterium]